MRSPISRFIFSRAARLGGLTQSIFLLTTAGLIVIAFVLQRLANVQANLQRRTRELAVLNEFGQMVAHAGFDADQVIALLVEYTPRVVHGDIFCVEVLNAKRDRVQLLVESRDGQAEWQRGMLNLSPAAVCQRDNPVSILARDLQQTLPFRINLHVHGQSPRAALSVPLLTGEQVLGAVTVWAFKSRTLSRADERNLNALTSQAAVALENADLYAVERRRATQLEIVSQVSRRVAQFLDLDELLQNVVQQIRDSFGYTHTHIFVRTEKDEMLFRATTHPLGEQWRARHESVPPGQGIVGWVMSTGEPVLAPDVTQDPHYLPGPDHALLNTHSELAVPLFVGEQIVGVLDVQSDQVGQFDSEDLFVLRALAAQIAVAIEDARLYALQKEEAWYLNVMLQVSENLSDTETLDEVLETIVRITPILVGVARCAVFLCDAEKQTLRAAKQYGILSSLQSYFAELSFSKADLPDAFKQMFETRVPVTTENVPLRELTRAFDGNILLLTPLIYRNATIGMMIVDQGARRFSVHEKQILMGISNQAAVAIANARLNEQAEIKKRFDYELGLARQIQMSFLPSCCPEVPGYDISAAWCAASEVSGDFYDFITLPDGRYGFTIADVSDKGMPAALFMALTRTLIRAMAIGKPTPKDALERANDLILTDTHTDMFVTALYGVLDTVTAQFSFTNAGHNPPLWYHQLSKQITTVSEHGLALGVQPNILLPERMLTLAPGDMLVMYTDGLTESLNAHDDEFGTARLAKVVAANCLLSANDLVDEILRAAADFRQGVAQFDDTTLLIVKRNL